MADSLAKAHEKLVGFASRMKSKIKGHEEMLGSVVGGVRSGLESALGGGIAAGLDYYLSPSVANSSGILEGMIGPVPVVPVAALAIKVGAFAMAAGDNKYADDVHNIANGLGAAATYTATMRLLQGQSLFPSSS